MRAGSGTELVPEEGDEPAAQVDQGDDSVGGEVGTVEATQIPQMGRNTG